MCILIVLILKVDILKNVINKYLFICIYSGFYVYFNCIDFKVDIFRNCIKGL